MRLRALAATTFLVLSCGACGSGNVPPTPDPQTRAEIARLRTISEAFRSITVELTEIGKGQDVDQVDSFAATLKYVVRLNNPTANEHLVIYSVLWQGRSFTPAEICHPDAFQRGDWSDRLLASEFLEPSESRTIPNVYRPFPSCFDFELSWSTVFIEEIDGVHVTMNIDQRIAELEGREYEY